MSLTELRNLTELKSDKQPETQLRPNRIQKDNQYNEALQDTVSALCEIFSAPVSASSHLCNRATGKAATEAVKECLTNILKERLNLQEKFQKECNDDPSRFIKLIQRRKVRNFASELTKGKILPGFF